MEWASLGVLGFTQVTLGQVIALRPQVQCLFLFLRRHVDRTAFQLFQCLTDCFVIGRMSTHAFEQLGWSQFVGDGGSHFTDHIRGAGAHHLGSQDLSGICVSDDLHKTSLFLGDQGFAVSAGDVLAYFHRCCGSLGHLPR